ncbi:hypothetical protein C0214_13535 [Methylobacterium sp. DM1]|nr:hypothetical protein C0214_13535 [Methylobacterium sp. DM1]
MSEASAVINLHQIYIVDGLQPPTEIPEFVQYNTKSMQDLHPKANYHLWCGDEIREFLNSSFDNDVLQSFDKLKPYAYKCDLARLCVVYEHGGIYADLGMRFIRPFLPPQHAGFAAFRSLSFLTDSWTTASNGLFWSRPRRKELEYSINAIIQNVRDEYYGTNPLCPTGPVLFGRSIARVAAETGRLELESDQWIGEVRRVSEKSLSTCHIAPDGEPTALNIKAGRNLGDLGVRGSNIYGALWASRDIYS